MPGVFDEELEKMKQTVPETACAHFGLAENVFGPTFERIDEFFVNYSSEVGSLLRHLKYVIDENTKRRILIVGKTGCGKTSLTTYFLTNLSHHQQMKTKHFPINLEKINFGGLISAKSFSKNKKEFLPPPLQLSMESVGILILDDLHELAYGNQFLTQKKISDILVEFEKEIRSMKGLTIYTTTPYFFREMLKDPTFASSFSQVIFLGPLDDDRLDEIIHKRLSAFKTNDNAQNPFPHTAITHIVSASKGNPRLMLSIADKSLTLAFAKNKQLKVVDDAIVINAINLIAPTKFPDFNKSEKRIIDALASQILCTASHISTIVGIDRSTISTYLNNFEKIGVVSKRQAGKEVYYLLNESLRNEIESELMTEIKQLYEELKMKGNG